MQTAYSDLRPQFNRANKKPIYRYLPEQRLYMGFVVDFWLHSHCCFSCHALCKIVIWVLCKWILPWNLFAPSRKAVAKWPRGCFASLKVINIYGGADIICPRNLHKFIGVQPVGCGDSTHRCRDSGTKSLILPTVGTALAAVRYRRSRYRVIAIVNCW